MFYNMSQGVAAGPALGFGVAFGKRLEETPWTSGPAEVTTRAVLERGFSVATGAGEAVQTLNGVEELGSIGLYAAEFASGVGEAKLIYDGVTFVGAVGGCLFGVIH